QHPNVVPVLAAGASSDGLPYYTMPFIAGASLRDRLTSGPLPLSEALTLLRDVARALAYAHEHGIVHRDIKPENVLLTGGAAVVADFGIARAVSAAGNAPALTQAGMAVGTPAYMAPEQAAGHEDVDHRADLYAWGLVAWETLAGCHPFADARSPLALIGAQLTRTPAPLITKRPDAPAALAAVIAQCLAKDPAERPAGAKELLRALDAVAITPPPTLAAAQSAASSTRTLAVLPIVNTSGDPENEHFSDGLTDELIGALSTVPALRVTGRTSSFALKGKGLGVSDVARMLGVDTMLEGSARRAGTRLKARVQLVSADGSVLWAEAYDRTLTDVFEVQEEIAQAVVSALRVKLGAGHGPIVRPPTTDIVAHDLYLKGRAALREGHPEALGRSIALYEQAVERDPGFAAAWAAMAYTYIMLPIVGDQPAREIAEPAHRVAARALDLDDRLAAAHLAMGHVCFSSDLDVAASARSVRRAIELDPGNPDAHQFYAIVLKCERHFSEAEAHALRALAGDPLHPFMPMTLGWIYLESGRAAQGLPYLERAVEVAPYFTLGREILVHAYLALGRHEDALREAQRAVEVGGRRDRALHAYVHAVQGRHAEARAILAELEAPSELARAPSCQIAYAYVALGEMDTAIRWIERAFEQRDPHLNGLATIPAYERLWSDARYPALVARLRHEPLPA
ncbi:MAG TPA: protein kinase, partial [Gemmatimonadaceae bacterium]|nr:protein kinase [Gemmatimonadaceae bacterium]